MKIFIIIFFASCATFADNARWLRYPQISPNGEFIIFSANGDLYKYNLENEYINLLTSHIAHEYKCVISSDNKK